MRANNSQIGTAKTYVEMNINGDGNRVKGHENDGDVHRKHERANNKTYHVNDDYYRNTVANYLDHDEGEEARNYYVKVRFDINDPYENAA